MRCEGLGDIVGSPFPRKEWPDYCDIPQLKLLRSGSMDRHVDIGINWALVIAEPPSL